MSDSIRQIRLSSVVLPLKTEISDAKVFTGRQRPMTEVHFLFAEIETADGHSGVGFSTASAPAARPSSPTPSRWPTT